ncbi:MAG TPA: hypothetical protein VED01_21325 [Burkholderiales bacterium]|nr:hypothetical protein [Burkholderiales bacterium]
MNTAPTFVIGDGKVTTAVGASDDYGRDVTLLPDGRILVAGYSYSGSNNDFALVRYNADGSRDTTFDGDGIVTTPIGTSTDDATSITLQTDGRILVAGYTWNGGNYDFALARYDANGSLDTTFDVDGKVTTPVGTFYDVAWTVVVQADGKILLGGYGWGAGNTDFAVVRYNADGTLDTSFDGDGKVTTPFGTSTDEGASLALQADGRIVVAGYTWNGANYDFALARYNTNGSLDTTFDSDGKLTTAFGTSDDFGRSVTVQSDGRILVAGHTWNGANYDFALARYNANGTLDTTFDFDGKVTTPVGTASDEAWSVTLQSDGKILAAGRTQNGGNYDFTLLRYNANGSLDTTFDGDGKVIAAIGAAADEAWSVTLQSDGRILVAGSSFNGSNSDFALLRFNSDGSLDTTFDAVTTLNGTPAYTENAAPVVLDADVRVRDAELMAQGHYAGASVSLARNGGANSQDVFSATGALSALTHGGSLVYSGVTVGTVTSHFGGGLVLTFNSNATQARVDGALQSIAYSNTSELPPAAVQINWIFNDGNLGGQGPGGPLTTAGSTTVSITSVNDAPLLGDGKVATPIGPFSDLGWSVAVQPDGKILLAGYASNGADNDFALARYHANGSLDTTFDADGKVVTSIAAFSDSGRSVALQSDGRIVVAGSAMGASGTDFALVRYNADGSLDTTFDVDGKVATAVGPGTDEAWSVTLQPDGKILAAGTASNGVNFDFALLRYNANGSLDTTFGSGGKVMTAVGTSVDEGRGVVVQPDGKILLAGYTSNGATADDFALVRYNANGSLDTTFDGDGKVITAIGADTDQAWSLALQSDGKILVAGASNNGSDFDFALVRYNANGSLDTTFDGDGKLTTAIGVSTDRADSVTLQPDGKILLAGFSISDFNSDVAVVRYNANGTLDPTFSGDGKLVTAIGPAGDFGASVKVQPDGKIVVGGRSAFGGPSDFAVVRYNPDGTLDPGFDAPDNRGPTYTEDSAAVVLDSDMRGYDVELASQGNYAGASLTLVRNGGANAHDVFSATGALGPLTQDAALVYSAVNVGTVTTNAGGTLVLSFNSNAAQASIDGVLQSIGYSNTSDLPPASVQIDWSFSDGNSGAQGTGGTLTALASTTVAIVSTNDAPAIGDGKVFTPVGTADDFGQHIALQADGRILLAGYSDMGGNYDIALVRYLANGALDTTFDGDGKSTTALGTFHDVARSVTLQADGKILVGGLTWNGATHYDFALLRYEANGTLDSTFDGDGRVITAVTAAYEEGWSVTVQPDGKILLAGFADTTSRDFALVRYNPDGSLDTSFDGDGKLTTDFGSGNDQGHRVALQPDGRILVSGFAWNGANNDFALVRYDSNGTLDTSFDGDGKLITDVAAFDDFGESIVVQPDGRILVAGSSRTGSSFDFSLVRYNADGSLDTSFDTDGKVTTGIGPDESGRSLALQADGKIIVAGYSWNGSDYDFALARYTTSGSLDTSFDGDGKLVTRVGPSTDYGFSVALQADGKIVVGGHSSNGSNYDFALVRYNVDGSLDAGFDDPTGNVAPTYTENGAAVLLDDDMRAYDAELAAQGHYAGASLTLSRSGAANAQDVFSSTGALGALNQGSPIVYSGVNVGTVVTNAGGTLALTFNASATQPRIDGVLQSITYSNASDAPASSVQIDWSFSDGNGGAQGAGGTLSDLTSTTVAIAAINDAPMLGDGKVTTPFGTGNDYGRSIALQSDGRILLAGYSQVAGNDDFAVARYNANGSLDTTFSGDGRSTAAIGTSADYGRSITLQPDGRILVGGYTWNGADHDFALTRFNAAGSLDTSFDGDGKLTSAVGSEDYAWTTLLQPDGRIVLAGHTGVFAPPAYQNFALVRYNANGSLDTTFDGDGTVVTDGGSVDVAYGAALQSDGKILITGTAWNGSSYAVVLVRYNTNAASIPRSTATARYSPPSGPPRIRAKPSSSSPTAKSLSPARATTAATGISRWRATTPTARSIRASTATAS